jgi:hypothetical protein
MGWRGQVKVGDQQELVVFRFGGELSGWPTAADGCLFENVDFEFPGEPWLRVNHFEPVRNFVSGSQ